MRTKSIAALMMIGLSGGTLTGGCASSSDKIAPQYVSSIPYQGYTCQQLGEEARQISSRVAHLSGVQDQKATSDAVATGVAIVVFWPAAFLVGGNDQTTAELARMKGELEAVEKASIEKGCGLKFQHRPVEPGGRDRAT